jgi:hypothetical protein
VLIKRSKTDKTREGQEIAIPRGYRLRPVEARPGMAAGRADRLRPVFRRVRLGGQVDAVALSGHAAVEIVKKLAERAGLDPVEFSGHSLRVGYVTSAS